MILHSSSCFVYTIESIVLYPFPISISDNGLEPFSIYEYSVSVVNSAGTTQSEYTTIKTLQARPEGLMAPNATLDPKQLYIIYLHWAAPQKPNGN